MVVGQRREAVVKLDTSHYFFTLCVPSDTKSGSDSDPEMDNLLNYGLTITWKGIGSSWNDGSTKAKTAVRNGNGAVNQEDFMVWGCGCGSIEMGNEFLKKRMVMVVV
ncbi:hypothetical protein L6452_22689 [Arctium lappa]|uniref:Uncharacterized protein n=1 Tax=Arctium lappa TaxID=4217 RepID=A0ACB9B196_ARCLA|nr:hypothetical protein L6452_22689 [Arctium lappa]